MNQDTHGTCCEKGLRFFPFREMKRKQLNLTSKTYADPNA